VGGMGMLMNQHWGPTDGRICGGGGSMPEEGGSGTTNDKGKGWTYRSTAQGKKRCLVGIPCGFLCVGGIKRRDEGVKMNHQRRKEREPR